MKIFKLMTMQLLHIYLLFILFPCIVQAENSVGNIVALRGKVIIERVNKAFEARVRDSVFMNDTVSTLEASRVKMLFLDDSVLTLGENSKVIIKEVFYSKHKMGRSIFRLLEGKMRSIVGKTHFEVHTPTAVAAARGTVILLEVGVIDGRTFTTIVCIEGLLTVSSSDPSIPGSITLNPGMMITIFEGEPLPAPLTATPELIERLSSDTEVTHEISVPGPAEIFVGPKQLQIEPAEMLPTMSPPIEQQPPVPGTSPVDINVVFPE